MTLLDEAELIHAFQGLHVWIDDLVSHAQGFIGDGEGAAASEDDANRVRQLHVKVIPDQAEYVDNYISEVGQLHSSVSNTMLWRRQASPGISDFPLIVQILGPGLHGYACEWYRQSVLNPTASLVGHRWPFERDSIGPMSQASTYFLQSLDVAASPLAVTPVDAAIAAALTDNPVNRVAYYDALQGYRAVAYPTERSWE